MPHVCRELHTNLYYLHGQGVVWVSGYHFEPNMEAAVGACDRQGVCGDVEQPPYSIMCSSLVTSGYISSQWANAHRPLPATAQQRLLLLQ